VLIRVQQEGEDPGEGNRIIPHGHPRKQGPVIISTTVIFDENISKILTSKRTGQGDFLFIQAIWTNAPDVNGSGPVDGIGITAIIIIPDIGAINQADGVGCSSGAGKGQPGVGLSRITPHSVNERMNLGNAVDVEGNIQGYSPRFPGVCSPEAIFWSNGDIEWNAPKTLIAADVTPTIIIEGYGCVSQSGLSRGTPAQR